MIVGKRNGCSRVFGLGVSMDCSGHHGIREADAYRSNGLGAGIVIGFVCFGAEPFAMIKIVSGNSCWWNRLNSGRQRPLADMARIEGLAVVLH